MKRRYSERQTSDSFDYSSVTHYELNKKLLILGGVLILGSAAIITALYLPDHMPTVIENIVKALRPAFFYMILGGSIAGIAAGAGAGIYEYNRYKKGIFYTPKEQKNSDVYMSGDLIDFEDSDEELGENTGSFKHTGTLKRADGLTPENDGEEVVVELFKRSK